VGWRRNFVPVENKDPHLLDGWSGVQNERNQNMLCS
jgi:hypothetical protein